MHRIKQCQMCYLLLADYRRTLAVMPSSVFFFVSCLGEDISPSHHTYDMCMSTYLSNKVLKVEYESYESKFSGKIGPPSALGWRYHHHQQSASSPWRSSTSWYDNLHRPFCKCLAFHIYIKIKSHLRSLPKISSSLVVVDLMETTQVSRTAGIASLKHFHWRILSQGFKSRCHWGFFFCEGKDVLFQRKWYNSWNYRYSMVHRKTL